VGRKQCELFPPELAERHSGYIQQVFRTGEMVVSETHEELHRDPVWIDTRLVPIRDAQQAVVAVMGIVRDVSYRRAAHQAMSEREAYLRAMLDNFPYLVWLKDRDSRFLTVNQTFARSCGKARAADLVGLTDFDVWPRELAERYVADDRQVIAHRGQVFVEEPILDRGTTRWFETFKTPVLDEEGRVLGTTGFARDITERRQMDKDLRDSREQLRALAAHVEQVREQERVRMAREIHDELGQSLTCMGMDLAFLDKHLPGDGPAKARVQALSALVKETIQTVRRISSELRPSMLDDLGLCAALEWLARDFEERTHIACRVTTPEEIPMAPERATAVFRICQEALTNVARHARAASVEVELAEARGCLTLRVHDDGRGITPDEIARPGSLGLLGMRERAGLLGGKTEISGQPGAGTTVLVTLPTE
jgi:hypothetical protein